MTKDEALKQIAGFTLSQFMGPHDMALACVDIARKTLAQPEHERVAWRNAALRVGEDLCSVGPFGYYDMTAEQWLDWALSVVTVHAPPPQRKPMTDEEITQVFGVGYVAKEFVEFVRAIEAAHGIKE